SRDVYVPLVLSFPTRRSSDLVLTLLVFVVYHKNEKGQYIPGIISDARKDWIKTMAELYKEGAIQKAFVLLNPNEANTRVFYSGKAGIMVGALRGMSDDYMKALKKIHPEAELAAIPPFEAPDGSRG